MTTIIACFISVVSTIGFVSIWFTTANRELSQARQSVINAAEELQMLMNLLSEIHDRSEKQETADSLEIGRKIYYEMVNKYHVIRGKPMNIIPALILGYRSFKDNI